MEYAARWDNLDGLRDDLAKLTRLEQGKAMRGALRAAAAPVLKQAKVNAPNKRVRRSLSSVVNSRGGTYLARVGPRKGNARLATLFERGVKPHVIRPRKKTVLAALRGTLRRGVRSRRITLNTANYSWTFFGRAVQHPGMAARPFLRPALPSAWPEGQRKFNSALRAIVTNYRLRALRMEGH